MCLVVAPLNSLMQDQVDNLKENLAINWLGHINSLLTPAERRQAQDWITQGRFLLTLISPERLQNRDFRTALSDAAHRYGITYAVIDEAHCVSEWGHDFRTSYLKLASSIRSFGNYDGVTPSIIALTGTASFAVLSDVQREIGV